MLLFLFLSYWLILFNSCDYCTIFNSIAELAIPTGIPTKAGKAEIETHLITAENKCSSVQYNLEKLFCAYYLSIHFGRFI